MKATTIVDASTQDLETPKGKSRILIVEDHPMMRIALTYLINREQDLFVCGEASNAPRAMELMEELKPDLVTVDITLEKGNGFDLIKDIRQRYSRPLILVVSAEEETDYAARALLMGAKGFLQKTKTPEKLILAIRRILGGAVYVSDQILSLEVRMEVERRHGQKTVSHSLLSDREFQVLDMLGKGFGPKEIAHTLSISVKTVEYHQERMKAKLSLADSSHLRQYATSTFRNGRHA